MKQHLNFSSVIALIALFAALGGGAYAASTAKKNSVTSKSIKDGSVTSNDVADDALTGADINESTLSLPTTGGGPVDAATLDGKDSADFLGANAKATDSDQLDGKDSADFLGVGDKAADADFLDGINSGGFVQGDAKMSFGGSVQPGPSGSVLSFGAIPGFGKLSVRGGTSGGGDVGVAKVKYQNDMPGGSNDQRVLTVTETGAVGADTTIEHDFVAPNASTLELLSGSTATNTMHIEYWVIGPVPSEFARYEVVGINNTSACLFTGQVTHSL